MAKSQRTERGIRPVAVIYVMHVDANTNSQPYIVIKFPQNVFPRPAQKLVQGFRPIFSICRGHRRKEIVDIFGNLMMCEGRRGRKILTFISVSVGDGSLRFFLIRAL